jgi:hypothetical protein
MVAGGISALLLGQIHISGTMVENALLAAVQEQEAETENGKKSQEAAAGTQQEGEKKAETTKFLADMHKVKGTACAGCHKEDPPAKETPTAVCLTCHSKIFTEETKTEAADTASSESKTTAEEDTSKPNPHISHMTGEECGACHHAHKESEDQCQMCHNFGYKIP